MDDARQAIERSVKPSPKNAPPVLSLYLLVGGPLSEVSWVVDSAVRDAVSPPGRSWQ